jgi:multidrug efflux pump subunit AcrA (membrane-fusion protein)
MGDSTDSRAQKYSGFRASIHELYRDDAAQLLLEKPSRATLAGVYGLFSGLLVALGWAWLATAEIAIPVRGELRPAGPVYAVASPYDGELMNLYVTAGMPVKQGDIIARVRSSELLAKTAESLQAQIDLMDAEKAYASVRQAGSILPERLGEESLSMRQAKLRLDLARLKAMARPVDPGHIDAEGALRLFSPIDGFVLEVFKGRPEIAAHQALAKIAATQILGFHVEVPEHERWRLREGLPVRIRLDASAGRKVFQGVLAYLARVPVPSASSAQPVYPGRVDIHESMKDPSHGPLRPGMHGRADIMAERRYWIDLVF